MAKTLVEETMKSKLRLILIFIILSLTAPVLAESVKFTATDINGKVHQLSDYKGKWVIVNYWATWCPPCLDEIPELVEFHEQHRDKDAVVLGVNLEEISTAELKNFVDQYFISYPVLTAEQTMSTPFGNIYGLPTTFLVSPDGEVLASKTGGVTQQDLEASIREFSKQSSRK